MLRPRRRCDAPRRIIASQLFVSVALVAGACVIENGGQWVREPDPDPPRVFAYVVADARDSRKTAAVARELAERRASSGGPPAFALWLGADARNERECKRLRERGPQLAALFEALGDVPIYAAGSPADYKCGLEDPPSLLRPDHNYVLDVMATGEARLVSTCESAACRVEEATPSTLARLVVVDETPWAFPALDRGAETASVTAQLDALLEALPPSPETSHILVTHLPIESGGSRGVGGWQVQATYEHHAPVVQAALKGGRFDGVIAGHEGSLQLNRDLSRAVKRSSRIWLRRPVFQVVAGSAGDPDYAHPATSRMRPRWQGIALRPDHRSPRAGFVEVGFAAEHVQASAFARHAGHWARTTVQYPLLAPPHPVESEAPVLAPCRDCDPREGAADRGAWFPGGEQ